MFQVLPYKNALQIEISASGIAATSIIFCKYFQRPTRALVWKIAPIMRLFESFPPETKSGLDRGK